LAPLAAASRKAAWTDRISAAGRGCNQHEQKSSLNDSMVQPQAKQFAAATLNTNPLLRQKWASFSPSPLSANDIEFDYCTITESESVLKQYSGVCQK